MTIFGDLFRNYEENEIFCLECQHFGRLRGYSHHPLKEILKRLKCSQCNSNKFGLDGIDPFNIVTGDDMSFKRESLVGISYPIYAFYGGLMDVEVMCLEKISVDKSIKREIESLTYGEILISEEYDLDGKLIEAKSHDLLSNYFIDNKLTPVKKTVNDKTVFEIIEIDYEISNLSEEENRKRYVVDRESEWILEIPYEHLEKVDDKYATIKQMYDWGNLGPRYSGFVNKTINPNNEFQRLYIVNGEIEDQHPVWTFDKDNNLLSLDCKLGDEDFNLFKK